MVPLINSFKSFFTKGDIRSISVKRNIAGSICLKCISIIVSLQVVPLTIDYIDSDRYGIWLTVSSIVAWLAYFDMGFANGFRNKFSEARSKDDVIMARAYVSTTYAALTVIFGVLFILSLVINNFLDWNKILRVNLISNIEFQYLFGILACFFCLNMIFGIFSMMLTADQKPALSSLISTSGQLLSFIAICLLVKFTSGNLLYLALAFSGIPCVVLGIVSLIAFNCSRYKMVAPKISAIRVSLVKDIIGLGGQFFIIMVSMLFIYQFINIIISRVEGAYAVTQYNVAYKYFNVLFMVFVIVLNPFWSATTDAFVRKDFVWMKRMVRKLEMLWLCSIPALIIMVLCANQIFDWWLDKTVTVPISVTIAVAIYIMFQIAGNIYMYIINGTGKVRVQLIIYGCFAVIAIPIMNYTCVRFGTQGLLLLPTLVYIIQAICCRMQLNKIMNETATGVWNK